MVNWEIRPQLPQPNNGNNFYGMTQKFGQPYYEYTIMKEEITLKVSCQPTIHISNMHTLENLQKLSQRESHSKASHVNSKLYVLVTMV